MESYNEGVFANATPEGAEEVDESGTEEPNNRRERRGGENRREKREEENDQVDGSHGQQPVHVSLAHHFVDDLAMVARVDHFALFSEETGVEDEDGGEENDGEENAVQEDGEGEEACRYANPQEG